MKRGCRLSVWLVMVAVPMQAAARATESLPRNQLKSGTRNPISQSQVRKLEGGKPIEREMKGGESHTYEIPLEAGQFLNAVVEQRGIDVVVEVIAPDGKQLMEVDSPNGTQGDEPAMFIAEAPGVYRLKVSALDKDAAPGKYEIRAEKPRAPTKEDRILMERRRALEEAGKLAEQADELRIKGKHEQAIPLAERALAIYEKVVGAEHISTADSLNNLGLSYYEKGDYGNAERFYSRALAVCEKLPDPENAVTASVLNNIAELWRLQGNNEKAEPLFLRALKIGEKTIGAESPAIATMLNNLALLYQAEGYYEKAEALYHRAVAICEKALGLDHPNTATPLYNLAELYREQGNYAKAESLYTRTLAIREKAFGAEHPATADSLKGLANLQSSRGDYAKAEWLYNRALAIYEKTLGSEHLAATAVFNNLAMLYYTKGDYEKAEPFYIRALTVCEKVLGAEHPVTATSLNNLGLLYYAEGDYAQARAFFDRALAIRMKALGTQHPVTAESLNNLAELHRVQGDYAKAEPLYLRALAIYETVPGAENSSTATLLNNLGLLYYASHEYDKAERFYTRALAINEKVLGAEHPSTANSLSNLALLYRAKGEYGKAVDYQSRCNAASERDLLRNLLSGSEYQKLTYLTRTSGYTDSTISLHAQAAPNDTNAIHAALRVLLQRKGRALDATTDAIGSLRRRLSSEDHKLLKQLVDVRSQLAVLMLRGPGREGLEKHEAHLTMLEDQEEELQNEISKSSAEFRAQSQSRLNPVFIEDVRRALPPSAALVEFAEYRPVNPNEIEKEGKFGKNRYIAYVLPSHGKLRWAELGDAEAINRSIETFRKALRDGRRRDVMQLARAVDRDVMQPVRKLLGATRHVLISPDGALNLLPFAALVDERGQYLVKKYHFTYLTSGRDLLRLRERIISKAPPLVIADADFDNASTDESTSRQTAAVNPNAVSTIDEATRAIEQRGPKLGDVEFEPLKRLAESAVEAVEVKRTLTRAHLLTRDKATETALKQISGPSILHIATHGFFLEKDVAPGSTLSSSIRIARRKKDESSQAVNLANPALRSGLFLAGANKGMSGDDDGVLTAFEAAGLDLWGTKLVVLSACDTGVGEVLNGEGVQGLRRALVLAGSESQMMSLWPVSDRGTRELMIEYYRRLKAGEGRSEALRQAQLRMLKNPKRQHPFYWASFIQSGEWANLDGKR